MDSTKRLTRTQQNALHLYCEWLAEELGNAGMDMRTVIKVPITPTKENVKELMLRPVMHALWPDITSTAKLDTVQVSQLYEEMNRFTGERLGIHVRWPSEEDLRRLGELNSAPLRRGKNESTFHD